MNRIASTIQEAVEGYNVHNDDDINEHDLLDPVIRDYTNCDSFEEFATEAGLDGNYEGISAEVFDDYILRNVSHTNVRDLHSLLTVAHNHRCHS